MINLEQAKHLIDFKGKNTDSGFELIANEQLKASVSLYNMMEKNGGLGYLADEVGMGKTYVALGTISLMRYINPSLKVLYILPKQNVLTKWYTKEYPNFLRDNFKVSNNKVKSFNHNNNNELSSVPQIECNNLIDLLKYSSTGYYGDFFIKMTSFSFALGNSESELNKKIDELKELLPSMVIDKNNIDKEKVKEQYSKAINKILPFFDLVVVDEAHNFRKGMEVSDRNKAISLILGTNNNNVVKKVDNILLLSATPYDRDIKQLTNQLKIFGQDSYVERLLEDVSIYEKKEILKEFMVRRLNKLLIGGKTYSRNQYRIEKRKEAAIDLRQIDKKLIVALVQKKVGDLLDEDSFKGQFQTGMLASFESYLPSRKLDKTNIESEFDNTSDSETKKAIDNNIIMHLHNSYTKKFNTSSLPHPKMDSVVNEYSKDFFENGNKHIIFVRRIQSVTDLKTKFDAKYDTWIEYYLNDNLSQKNSYIYIKALKEYKKQTISKKSNVNNKDDDENNSNNFFTYFFRGKNSIVFDIKNKLNTVSKDDNLINVFEINWFNIFNHSIDYDKLNSTVRKYWGLYSRKYQKEKKFIRLTKNEKFHLVQISYLENINQTKIAKYYKDKFKIEEIEFSSQVEVDHSEISSLLTQKTFFNYVKEIFDFNILNEINDMDKLYFITSLISSTLRLGHGIIDIFIAYTRNENRFLENLIDIINKQKKNNIKFCTYKYLQELITYIDLIIRNNFNEFKKDTKNQTVNNYLKGTLTSEPIIGARGGSGDKSAIAKKFRMPGYPMILISTDVLQEGEDLHTFCDSTVHYGLANSPIAIEQKNGRVDRIGSLAHRNLQSEFTINDNNKLKVSFPFVQQSVEVVQIYNIANNLNEFIKSIDSFESKEILSDNTIDDILNIKSIPDQIKQTLTSPFEANNYIQEKNTVDIYKIVKSDQDNIDNIKNNINNLIKTLNIEEDIAWKINVAKSSSELILDVKKMKMKDEKFNSRKKFLLFMKENSYNKYHRTYINKLNIIDNKSEEFTCDLYFDIQILVGNEILTQRAEIEEVFGRISDKLLLLSNTKTIKELYNIINLYDKDDYLFFRNHEIKLDIKHSNENIEIEFKFAYKTIFRKQKVKVTISAGYIIFTSLSTEDSFIDTLSVYKILEYTWVRNSNIDIVEFVVDNNNAIIGRIVFPIENIQTKELFYYAYILACEADHLEQILYDEDKF